MGERKRGVIGEMSILFLNGNIDTYVLETNPTYAILKRHNIYSSKYRNG